MNHIAKFDKCSVSSTHEVCHGTRSFFKRANIRNDNNSDENNDHSTIPGLMDPWGTQPQFNPTEQKILKGEKR